MLKEKKMIIKAKESGMSNYVRGKKVIKSNSEKRRRKKGRHSREREEECVHRRVYLSIANGSRVHFHS